jgi:hypothetical protein
MQSDGTIYIIVLVTYMFARKSHCKARDGTINKSRPPRERLGTNVDSFGWLNLLNNREQFVFQPNVMCHVRVRKILL